MHRSAERGKAQFLANAALVTVCLAPLRDPVIGTKIGFYEITKQLGEGGMGAVYLAVHSRIGNRKVVKVLLPQYSKNEHVVQRFENEAKAAARLDHRNIVKIDDFGLLPNGQWYILMPFLEGSSLEAFLASHGKLTIHQALHILVQICAALEAAHRAGIVHRDLKPANVFLTYTEDNPRLVTLLDFGIAKLGGSAEGLATQTGAAFGTPAYMAVEQFEDASRADAKSDLFALGVIAYQMLSGTLPFGAAPGPVLYNKQITTRPPRLPGVPFEWAELVMRALSLRPVDRPESARVFAVALAAVTPEDPPFDRSGAEILAAVARELLSHAPTDAETMRANADPSRVAAVLRGQGVPVAGAGSGDRGPAGAAVGAEPVALSTLTAPALGEQAPAQLSTRPRRRWQHGVVGVVAVGAVLLAVVLLAAKRSSHVAMSKVSEPPSPSSSAHMSKPSLAPGSTSVPRSVPEDTPPTDLSLRPTSQPPAVRAGQRTSTLTIETSPPGAVLVVDGRNLGAAPQSVEVIVGSRLTIHAELAGRAPAVRSVLVAVGTSKITLRLEKIGSHRGSEKTPAAKGQGAGFDPNAVGGGP
jgi:serine/threonine protein kinase